MVIPSDNISYVNGRRSGGQGSSPPNLTTRSADHRMSIRSMVSIAPHKDFLSSVLIIALGATLFSLACSGPTTPTRDIIVTVPYDDFEKNHNYSGDVRLSAGGTLTVKLFSNATTGALWTDPVQISNPIVLEQTGHQYIPPLIPNPGAGGQEVWTFHASSKGDCIIYTEYKRPSQMLPTWTFTLAVTVI